MNCLINTLDMSLNDKTVPAIDEWNFNINNTLNYGLLSCSCKVSESVGNVVRTDGCVDLYLDGVKKGEKMSLSYYNSYFAVGVGSGKIFVNKNEQITYFQISNQAKSLYDGQGRYIVRPEKQVFVSDAILNFILTYAYLGDFVLSDFDFPNAKELNLQGCYIASGDISELSSKEFTSLNIASVKKVTGTIESLLDKMFSAGRTSGTMKLNLVGSSVTYNSAVPTASLTATFSSTGWTIA